MPIKNQITATGAGTAGATVVDMVQVMMADTVEATVMATMVDMADTMVGTVLETMVDMVAIMMVDTVEATM